MAIRSSSLARAYVPVGGPAGLPGQSTFSAWLTLPGNAGKQLADFIAAQKGEPGGVTTLAGRVGALSLDDIGAQAKDGDFSPGHVTPSGGAQSKSLADWLGDLSGALTYVPTLSAKLTLAKWLDAPARPQWWGAACDGVTDDTGACQAAITGATAAGLRLRLTGTCSTRTLSVPSSAQIDAVQSGGFKLAGAVGPILSLAAGADNVLIEGLLFDHTSIGTASGDAATSAIAQAVGGGGGRVVIRNNRFKALAVYPANNHALILNGATAVVSGNYAEGTGGDTYNFNGGYAHVTSNFVGYSGDGGIAFNNGARGVVVGNTLVRCTLGFGAGPEGGSGDADQIQSMIFANNTLEGCSYGVNMGWFAYAGRAGPVNWAIANNVFRNTKNVAINYDGHAPGFVANGAITGNVIWRTGSATFDGSKGATPIDIRLVNAGGVTVAANTLRDSLGVARAAAIYAQGSPNIAITGNAIAQSGANQYDTGIFLYDTQFSTVSANIVNGALNGIKLDQSATADYVASITGNNLITILYAGVTVGGSGGNFQVNGNMMTSVGSPGTPTAGVVIGAANGNFSVQDNLIRWASGVAISDPPGRAWANWLIAGNNTGGGSIPAGATGAVLVAPSAISGLTLSNDATTPASVIGIAPGSATSSNGAAPIVLKTALSKSVGSAWSAGSGGGALDTGTLAASTWYHVYLIGNPATGATDVIVSTSATAPALPSGYSLTRRIGAIRTDASSNVRAFKQLGDRFIWGTSVTDLNGSVTTTAALIPLTVPTGVQVEATFRASVGSASNAVATVISSPDEADLAPTFPNISLMNASGINAGVEARVRTDTSGRVRARGAATASFGIQTYGWVDPR
ncbi:right-handed parallel beta-helix repeat-containing protein [Methylobacterium sp. yr668]|uniref:right-handed parallel beta-helix repeat-containing protein n=1 Tax=Methylobacterium sp. yr668 TaxID=1761801 RepID=UPI0008E20C02|nr:right-handed parallel beta-helix repeat-containing protein [Methylobacterium sp. yr668]SFT11875.1 hypothetical protein SAMN04487845_11743 [Methylobacterium sp. yr668]